MWNQTPMIIKNGVRNDAQQLAAFFQSIFPALHNEEMHKTDYQQHSSASSHNEAFLQCSFGFSYTTSFHLDTRISISSKSSCQVKIIPGAWMHRSEAGFFFTKHLSAALTEWYCNRTLLRHTRDKRWILIKFINLTSSTIDFTANL